MTNPIADKPADELLRFTQFALDNLPDAAYWVERDATVTYVNDAACRMLGYTKAELLGMRITDLNVDFQPALWDAMWQKLKHDRKRTFETRHRAKDGRIIPVEISSNFIEFNAKESSWAFARDITQRQELESRLRQAEKLEAIGQLAGGVAHDFNNQLACILGNAELLEHLAPTPEQRQLVDNILVAVRRSADLTTQLLAFSRRGKYRSEPVDVHRLIEEVVEILSRSIDKRISLSLSLDAARAVTVGDPSQLQNALLNLAINARDAMPTGGRLCFVTENISLPETAGPNSASAAAREAGPVPGEYVRVSVVDTGVGMDGETQRRLFEPFFTTKGLGRGTGLGMAAVYGTVKAHKGWIAVHSAPGRGTTVEVHLRVGAHSVPTAAPRRAPPPLEGPVRILLVDDEALVREATQRLLEVLGCEVTVCHDGQQALEYYRAFHASIDLVIVDMVMPVKDGRDTVIGMREMHPQGKILVASGYSREGTARGVMDAGIDGFIQKPYTQRQLWEAISRILARDADATT